MRRIKGRSATKLFESFPDLRKRYWGRHFWARGYFCATSGELTEEMIKQYLEHHFEPKGKIILERRAKRVFDPYPILVVMANPPATLHNKNCEVLMTQRAVRGRCCCVLSVKPKRWTKFMAKS